MRHKTRLWEQAVKRSASKKLVIRQPIKEKIQRVGKKFNELVNLVSFC